MIGQMQVLDLVDLPAARLALLEQSESLLAEAARLTRCSRAWAAGRVTWKCA